MKAGRPIEGVNCAAATPVTSDGKPDFALFVAHCQALIAEGCHGIAPLGTTGEANSLALHERRSMLEAAINGGIPARVLMPGTSTPSVTDSLALTRHAVSLGVKACVLLPPYYYKNISDDGLFTFYSRIIDGVGDDRLRVILYVRHRSGQNPAPRIECLRQSLRLIPSACRRWR